MPSFEELFLTENPKYTISEDNSILENLWEDESISCAIPEDRENFFKALLEVRYPTQLSALLHPRANSVEIIFTAYKHGQTYIGRKFKFCFEGK